MQNEPTSWRDDLLKMTQILEEWHWRAKTNTSPLENIQYMLDEAHEYGMSALWKLKEKQNK